MLLKVLGFKSIQNLQGKAFKLLINAEWRHIAQKLINTTKQKKDLNKRGLLLNLVSWP
jgi:hypothetical protein